jgi:hypothetical protein
MRRVIYFFPDTNLFLQCSPLDQLDWSCFGADRVDLVVTRPMIAEVDSHKGKGNGRTAKRARKAASDIGQALTSDTGYLSLGKGTIEVRLCIEAMLKENKDLTDQLSYTERDHQLVGIASKFAADHPDRDVRVLTHDNGVLAAAQAVGVKFERIPSDWLLPPETDERDKQIAALQSQVKKFQDTEPKIEINLELSEVPTERIEVELPWFPPLADEEIAKLIEQLRATILAEIDFGPKEERLATPPGYGLMRLSKRRFIPATDNEIADYQDAYLNWLEACKLHLRTFDEKINASSRWPTVRIRVENSGSRPAEDALISFSAEGNFMLEIPSDEDDTDSIDEASLPLPPTAPKGRWEEASGPHAEMQKMFGRMQGFRIQDHPGLDIARLMQPQRNDPNDFYYRGGRPQGLVKVVQLTCQQWRHQMDAEDFHLELHWLKDVEQPVQGVLRVEVHAANMASSVRRQFPVTLTFTQEDIFEEASALIDILANRLGRRSHAGSVIRKGSR